MGGPPSKAKYSLATDSEPVPWGKGEKNPCEGSEIEPETMCLQGVGAQHFLVLERCDKAKKCNIYVIIYVLVKPKIARYSVAIILTEDEELKARIKASIERVLESAGWLRAFCLMSLRVSICGKLKIFWIVGVGKPSPNRASMSCMC